MENNIFQQITKKYSTTFYYSTLLFPRDIRNDVFMLYAFLRTADNLVDEKKDKKTFLDFKKSVYLSLDKKNSNDIIIKSFVSIFRKHNFKKEYLDSFFKAQEFDLKDALKVKTNQELGEYVYGVAGVVGLMMAKIMNLPEKLYEFAVSFGETMQMVNIIRDIKEDFLQKRVYIPQEDIFKFNLKNIDDYKSNEEGFKNLIRYEINKVKNKLISLSNYIEKIPFQYRRPIRISRDVYFSIANKIYKNPMGVWQKRFYVPKYELLQIFIKDFF
jgi:phytoene synthase